MAVGSSYRGEVCSKVEPLRARAENILYRLCSRLFLDGDYDDLDRFFGQPDSTEDDGGDFRVVTEFVRFNNFKI